jgi:arylformamidase
MMLACDWKRIDAALPKRPVSAALALSGVFDLEPIRHTPFLQGDLRLTPESVARVSPARFADPGGLLHALVGGDESEEFIRQNRLIGERWGPRTVPVCETVEGTNHFTVLHELAAPDSRVHMSALDLLGLR